MTWRKEVTPNFLHEMFPDVALQMETDYLLFELQKLEIEVRVRHRNARKIPFFEIATNSNHIIRITPVDRGACGYAEWFTWMPRNNFHHQGLRESSYEGSFPQSSMRVYVEIFDSAEDLKNSNHAFTVVSPDIEQLLRLIIKKFKDFSGIELDFSRRKEG